MAFWFWAKNHATRPPKPAWVNKKLHVGSKLFLRAILGFIGFFYRAFKKKTVFKNFTTT
jgi:hypothetical protein